MLALDATRATTQEAARDCNRVSSRIVTREVRGGFDVSRHMASGLKPLLYKNAAPGPSGSLRAPAAFETVTEAATLPATALNRECMRRGSAGSVQTRDVSLTHDVLEQATGAPLTMMCAVAEFATLKVMPPAVRSA